MIDKNNSATETGLEFFGWLFTHQEQYVNWLLVIIGWIIVVVVAYFQYKKSKNNANVIFEKECRINLIKELTQRLDDLEDSMILFWLSDESALDYFNLEKYAREIKQINILARRIVDFSVKLNILNTINYDQDKIIELRRLCTNISEHDLKSRPLNHNQALIIEIRSKIKVIRDKFNS